MVHAFRWAVFLLVSVLCLLSVVSVMYAVLGYFESCFVIEWMRLFWLVATDWSVQRAHRAALEEAGFNVCKLKTKPNVKDGARRHNK